MNAAEAMPGTPAKTLTEDTQRPAAPSTRCGRGRRLLRSLTRRDPPPTLVALLLALYGLVLYFCATSGELFPGSRDHGIVTGISSADGILVVPASPLAGVDASAFDRGVAWDTNPMAPPELRTSPELVHDEPRRARETRRRQNMRGNVGRTPDASFPATPTGRGGGGTVELSCLAGDAEACRAAEGTRAAQHGSGLPRSSRLVPKLYMPLSLYHTRLHMYVMYAAHRQLRSAQMQRLQLLAVEERHSSQPRAPRPTAREAHYLAELRQLRFASYVQRSYMRALRHADAMRMESLHYLRLFAMTVPALAGAWKGDDYCRWMGVSCRTVHVPLYKLLDERHAYVQAYSLDVFERLPAEKQAAVLARFTSLLALGDKINIGGFVRDEAGGFAQGARDLVASELRRAARGERKLGGPYHTTPRPDLTGLERGADEAKGGVGSHDSDATASAEVRRRAAALWYLLADNATGTGLPSRVWRRGAWLSYPVPPPRARRATRRHWRPPETIAVPRDSPLARVHFRREHVFPAEHPSLLPSPPRLYVGSVEGHTTAAFYQGGSPLGARRRARGGGGGDVLESLAASPPTATEGVGGGVGGNSTGESEAGARTTTTTSTTTTTATTTAAAMDHALRELLDQLRLANFTVHVGLGTRDDLVTIPVTVFSLHLPDLGLAGTLPRRSDRRSDVDDCDGWGDGDDCRAHFTPPSARGSTAAWEVVGGSAALLRPREEPPMTMWFDPYTRPPSPLFPAELVTAPPMELPSVLAALLPYTAEDEPTTRFRGLGGGAREDFWKLARLAQRMEVNGPGVPEVEREVAAVDRDALVRAEQDRHQRHRLDFMADAHGVTLTWPHVLQGEQARRRWTAEEAVMRVLRPLAAKGMHVVGPRAPSYWLREQSIRSVLMQRSTVPGRGYDSAAATDLAVQLRRVVHRLELYGFHTAHHDLVSYFGYPTALAHIAGESEDPARPFPTPNETVAAQLAARGYTSDSIAECFFTASLLRNPLTHVDDDVIFGRVNPALVPLVTLDVRRNPALTGVVPPHYFRFPLLTSVEVSATNIIFRIASQKFRWLLNVISNDFAVEGWADRRVRGAFAGSHGNYRNAPVRPFMALADVLALKPQPCSHLPPQRGSRGGGGEGGASRNRTHLANRRGAVRGQNQTRVRDSAEEVRELGGCPALRGSLATLLRSVPAAEKQRAPGPLLLAANTQDVRLTNALMAERHELGLWAMVRSTARTLLTREGVRSLLGFEQPLF